ncbi:quinoprotein dehydrogenase-associated SoxYZ-like carrier [Methylobacterium sp. E-016]|uniref:quinoprotein dehydrogenase-associated SoxYZ-like carrier n=1 Tax=Methylobacterium sp. E-016 TaxID=2836556 RepID=UPI001FBA4A29|nr:quinoprotein dehydrogenase-associated SoxYZ-like carrier [Methylobacterium sp. E-016]MCJ2076239.1 quinoprotein dehydrogenase-associated SoxYZ-like carrier [Methylobacterium sp. E-016]
MRHIIQKTVVGLAVALPVLASAGVAFAAAGDGDAERAARWQELQKQVFGDRKVEPGKLVSIDMPVRAEDAALVPVTLTVADKDQVKGLYLIIDDNPAPLAAHVDFGPAGDPAQLKMRVRVNTYSNVHAVAETKDGRLVASEIFVKASGGCSAPMGMTDADAMKGMGDMRMKFSDLTADKAMPATLMIRHPNFSGMQMNQVSREYTPARYLDRISVSQGARNVFTLEGDISISSNPVIGFEMRPEGSAPITVAATDSQGGTFDHTFPVPAVSN